MAGLGGNSQLSVSVPTDVQTLEVREPAKAPELRQRAREVRTETVDIRRSGGHLPQRVFRCPQPLIRGNSHAAVLPHFLHVGQGVLHDRLFDKVDLIGIQASQIPQSLFHVPCTVGIQANLGLRADGLPEGPHHLEFRLYIEADLQIEDMKTLPDSLASLFHDMVGAALRAIEEIVRPLAYLASEELVQGEAGGLPTNVPERHVDAGVREARGVLPPGPDPAMPEL